MLYEFSRTELLFGSEAMKKLEKASVIVFGVGGVGSYAVEALARSGIGTIALVDNDKISITNINRQLIATHKTIGNYKTEEAKKRILDINPNANVITYTKFYSLENADEFDLKSFNYIIDAIDTVTSKIDLAVRADKQNINIISSMGAGNKLNPERFQVADIYKTSVCPLAKVMRYELKKRGVKKLKVVYSTEIPLKPYCTEEESPKRCIPASAAFVPSVAGLIMAGEVIKDLTGIKGE